MRIRPGKTISRAMQPSPEIFPRGSQKDPIFVVETSKLRTPVTVPENARNMDNQFIVRPRPKKSLRPPPSKKRRTNKSGIEEISFDFDARSEYLTGFHKRKVQRAKAAQEQAARLAREERITTRKQVSSGIIILADVF